MLYYKENSINFPIKPCFILTEIKKLNQYMSINVSFYVKAVVSWALEIFLELGDLIRKMCK